MMILHLQKEMTSSEVKQLLAHMQSQLIVLNLYTTDHYMTKQTLSSRMHLRKAQEQKADPAKEWDNAIKQAKTLAERS